MKAGRLFKAACDGDEGPSLIPSQTFVCLKSELLMFWLLHHGEGTRFQLKYLCVWSVTIFRFGCIYCFCWLLLHAEIGRSAEGCDARSGCMDG